MTALDDYLASFAGEQGYLNWAALGPLSPVVRAATQDALDALGGYDAHAHALVFARAADARETAARLLGIPTEEVVLRPTSTDALQHALFGIRGGAVIASSAEFPSISLTLQRASEASAGAVSPRWISPADGRVTTDAVAAALDDDVTALAVSHVDYRTGYRADIPALRELIGPDRLLIVDAVQSFGVVEEDWSAADVIACHGYKWLRAGRGTGFAAFSTRARELLRPVLSGTTGTVAEGMFVGEIPPVSPQAKAFTTSVPDHLAAVRLASALDELSEVGVPAIARGVAENAGRMLELAERHGIPSPTPREASRRAGIVSLTPGDPEAVGAALADAGIAATVRAGAVRVSAHAGTSAETLGMLDAALSRS